MCKVFGLLCLGSNQRTNSFCFHRAWEVFDTIAEGQAKKDA